MAKKRQPFTFESNLDKIVEKIEEKPTKVLGTIGQSLTKEVKGTLRQFYRKRTGDLDKSVRYSQNRKLRNLPGNQKPGGPLRHGKICGISRFR